MTELAGAGGAKLHTAPQPQRSGGHRSAAVDASASCVDVARAHRPICRSCCSTGASAAGDVYLPGYTHLQRAQPVLLAHHLLAHGWALGRDVDRLLATVERLDVSPLGAGALAGSSLPIDPAFTAAELGFAARRSTTRSTPSATATSSPRRCSTWRWSAIHLSRIGEEWVLWTSEEFGFARLDDAYATGSSMLPQKKNPDIAELARGKAGRLIGNLTGFLATLKGLPLTYNRDLQEDKEPLFDSVDQITLGVAALTGMIATATCVPERMQAAADAETTAGDRSRRVARAARHAVPRRARRRRHARAGATWPARARCASWWQHDLGRPDAAALVAPGVGVRQRTSPGAAGPQRSRSRLDGYRAMLVAQARPAPTALRPRSLRRARRSFFARPLDRRRARAAQQAARRRRQCRAHRRGRGLHARRSGEPRVPRPRPVATR